MNRNLVLTLASALSEAQLDPFLFSFRRFVKGADLVVFTNRLQRSTRESLSQTAKELVDFPYLSVRMRHPQCLFWPLWKLVFSKLKEETSRRALARRVFNLFFLRALLYLEYLEKLDQKPEWVFLTDSRDVVFQDDLFTRFTQPGLYCFLEEPGMTIGSCIYNSAMVRHCFGKKAVEEIGNYSISCAGTVLGDYESIRLYLQIMVGHAMAIDFMSMKPGDDQGLHNYLIRKNLLPNIRLIDNDSGPVGTMGYVPVEKIRGSKEGMILQNDGRPYAVLHQLDRHISFFQAHQKSIGATEGDFSLS